MSMLMMGLKGIGAVLLFVLLCPILYTVRLNDRKLAVTVRLFLCVPLRREFDFSGESEEAQEEMAPSPEVEKRKMDDVVTESSPSPEETVENPSAETEIMEEMEPDVPEDMLPDGDNGPSVWQQIEFAWTHGFMRRTFQDVKRILAHSWPGYFYITGRFGTGDPMQTGIIAGVADAVMYRETRYIEYDFTEKVNTLEGRCGGFINPLVILWIAVRWMMCGETRAFWHFREGINHG